MAASTSSYRACNSEAKTAAYRIELALANQNCSQAHNGPPEVSNGKGFNAETDGASILLPFFFLLYTIKDKA